MAVFTLATAECDQMETFYEAITDFSFDPYTNSKMYSIISVYNVFYYIEIPVQLIGNLTSGGRLKAKHKIRVVVES